MFNRNSQPDSRVIDTHGLTPQAGSSNSAAPRMHNGRPVPPVEERYALDAPAAADDTVTLSRGYLAHGEMVQRLRFRRPTAKDLRQTGNPFKIFTAPGPNDTVVIDEVIVDWDKAVKCVVALSDPPLPPSTVDQFELSDLDACAEALVHFFMMRSTFRMSSPPPIGSPTPTA